jgi:hypothetical protein
MPSFVATTHQARSALLCGTKHFGEPSVSLDSSLTTGTSTDFRVVPAQLGYCVDPTLMAKLCPVSMPSSSVPATMA